MDGSGGRELKNKIDELVDIYNNDGKIKHVKSPKLLISSLKELCKIIGNDQIKGEMATAISFYFLQKERIEKGIIDENDDNAMVNTLIYGPPGVGKTTVALCISKIFYSLGCLKEEKKEGGVKSMLKKHLKESTGGGDDNELMIYYFFILLSMLVAIGGFLTNMVRTLGLKFALIGLLLLVILFAAFMYFMPSFLEEENMTRNGKDIEINKLSKMYDADYFDEENLFKTYSREDFVGKYQGFTEDKTHNILYNNIGKVIFVDEAYNLCHGPHDTYGNVALTQINLFMSQNPGKIIFIFAGYKDEIAENIFSAQKGLERRFMYKFNCTGYTGKELFNIFEYQAAKKGWKLSEKDKIEKFIVENYKLFKNYGGDTERLLFFCEKEFAKNIKCNVEDPINFRIVSKAFKNFNDNTFEETNTPFREDGIEFLGKLKELKSILG